MLPPRCFSVFAELILISLAVKGAGTRGKDDLSYWNSFVSRFFSTNGVFRHTLHIIDADETTDKQYEIAYPAIARYFHTNFSSGVRNMQLVMNKGTTDRPLPADCHFIENTQASLVYWFETGSHVSYNPYLASCKEVAITHKPHL